MSSLKKGSVFTEGNSLGDIGTLISKLGENPEMLGAVSSLMGMLSQTKKEAPKPPPAPEFDASSLLGLLSSFGGSDNSKPGEQGPMSKIFGTKEEMHHRIALLNAVKPYLSEERREKLDTVIKLLKLTELGELSGLLNRT